MIIIPAIDIIGGECVRLVRGDYATAEKVAADPFETAASFKKAGAEWLHLVDLDGAKAGKPINSELIFGLADRTGLRVEVGGGIRTIAAVSQYIEGGAQRVILGSAALKNQELVREAVSLYGDKIAVGIDANGRFAASEGWTESSQSDYIELAKKMEASGVSNIIYTDISRDGTLSGPSLERLAELAEAVSCKITASGGVCCLSDITSLRALGIYGAICGKSLYSGTLDLSLAIAAAMQ